MIRVAKSKSILAQKRTEFKNIIFLQKENIKLKNRITQLLLLTNKPNTTEQTSQTVPVPVQVQNRVNVPTKSSFSQTVKSQNQNKMQTQNIHSKLVKLQNLLRVKEQVNLDLITKMGRLLLINERQKSIW